MPLVWGVWGESFLTVSEVLPAEVLVVEGWIGSNAMPPTVDEFHRGDYLLLVTAGCSSDESWGRKSWNYADMAAKELVRAGMIEEQLLSAPAGDHDSQRTYASALAIRRILEKRGPLPKAINVVTRGSHARRSRLVFEKVFGSETRVGVISWSPESTKSRAWWKSSERSRDFLDETVAYFFERLLGSGRWAMEGES